MSTREVIKCLWDEKKYELIGEGIVGILISLVSGAVLTVVSAAFKANVMLSIIGGILLAMNLCLWLILRFLRTIWRENPSNVHAKVFLDQLELIPEDDDDDWTAWLDRLESLLRGMGMLRKSQVLRRMIQGTQTENRAFVAENFLRGLAWEVRFGSDQ